MKSPFGLYRFSFTISSYFCAVKFLSYLAAFAAFFLITSCNNGKVVAEKYPAPGTLIDSIGQPIVEDSLNNSISYVTIKADSSIKDGIYDIHAEYGNNIADGKFAMPKGLKNYTLKLIKTDTPYFYLIGFRYPEDTIFHEYMLIKSLRNSIAMKYLKSYTFE